MVRALASIPSLSERRMKSRRIRSVFENIIFFVAASGKMCKAKITEKIKMRRKSTVF